MAKYRPIETKFWKNPNIIPQSKDAKYLFVYLCTNELVNSSGIYPISLQTIAHETSVDLETVQDLILNHKIRNVFYDPDNQVVFVKGVLERTPGNPKVIEKTVLLSYKETKESPLWSKFLEVYPDFSSTFNQPLGEGKVTLSQPLTKGLMTITHDNEFENKRQGGAGGEDKKIYSPPNGNGNGNGHHPPAAQDMGRSPEVVHWKSEANRFLKHAQTTHEKVRGSPLVLGEVRDTGTVVKLIASQLSVEVLIRCWDCFLADDDPWLDGKGRTISIFKSRINDYLARTRTKEHVEQLKKQEKLPPPRINPDPAAETLWESCLQAIKRDILPENFESWLECTVGLVVNGERIVIGVPTKFHAKCLPEHYSKNIKKALAKVGIKPAPKLEFIHEYELTNA